MGRGNGTFYEVATLGDQNIDFLKDIAADSPVPAGGAAAVYTSCLAFGLLHKVILLQLHRDRSEVISENRMILARKDVKRLLEDMERLVAEDSESYLRFAQ
jgi:formiminotetrahydrofolate cyclodeaminase